MTKPKKASTQTPSCACSLCKHQSAEVWRDIMRPSFEERGPSFMLDRWHEYAPRLREVAAELPPHAVRKCYWGVQQTPALRDLMTWCTGGNDDDDAIAVLAGSHGTGKTVAAVFAAMFCFAEDSPVFVTAHKLSRELRDKETRRASFRRCLDAGVLIIDDLGKEQASSHFARDIDELVDTFYQGHATMIATTNLKPSAFRDRYGEGAYDRMRERATWFNCSGKSLRGVKPIPPHET